jgi:hypothetical protein
MANCQKYTRGACGHLFKHYERAKDENGEYIKFGNQDIDATRTYLNYNLAPDHSQGDFVKQRCSEVKMQKRADVNVMCSWVVTAPKEIREEETEKFFEETYKFLSDRYGKENIISAYVHMDEVSPHVHFAFVPVVMDKKKNILKVSAKELITKLELKSFHGDLSNHMEKIFGRDVGILNEATKEGNQSIEELKRGTAVKKLKEIEKATENFEQLAEENKKKAEAEAKRITEMQKELKNIEKIYSGKKLTQEDIKNLKPTKDIFGIKNITLEDIEDLKKTAIGTAKKEVALTKAQEKIKALEKDNTGLKKENRELKNKIPTAMQQLEINQRLVRIQDLEKENARLKNIIEKIKSILSELPERIRELISNIINPGRVRSRNEWER